MIRARECRKSLSGVTAWREKRQRCKDGLVGRTDQGEKEKSKHRDGEGERDTRDKNDKKGNPGWRAHGRKGKRRRDREPLTSKTPFPCIPPRFPMITSTLLFGIAEGALGIEGRASYIPMLSSIITNNLLQWYFMSRLTHRILQILREESDEIRNQIGQHDRLSRNDWIERCSFIIDIVPSHFV